MNRFLTLLILATSGSGFAQGLINFHNTPSTLISALTVQTGVAPISGPVGEWEFALLTSPAGANNFSFAGVYGTNTTTVGMFTGGAGVAVNGWAAGTARDFAVFGWIVNSVVYNPSWVKPDLSIGSDDPDISGVSIIGNGIAGGVTGSGTVPTLNIFGGPTGIQQGFLMGPPPLVPEPSSIALGGVGAVFLIMWLRKKSTQDDPRGD